MRVLYVSVEVSPFAKVGGLADVAGSLPKALNALGHETIVLMPAYGMVVRDPAWKVEKLVQGYPVRLRPSKVASVDLYQVEQGGFRTWMVDVDRRFSSISRSEEVYSPKSDDYLAFAEAGLALCEKMGWMPEVVHCNDWHTAFMPVLMREKHHAKWSETATVYTIHNLAYQGEFGPEVLDVVGLPRSLFTMNKLETWGRVNFLKSGCVYSDQVNTVSPQYAREIQTAEFGCTLHGLMGPLYQEGRLRGILNGIDVEVHNPETDPKLPARFSASDLSGKHTCRQALIKELGLEPSTERPILGVVSRLSNQKGFDLIVEQAARILRAGSLVVLGTGDPWSARELRRLEFAHPGKLRLVEAFDVDLAQRIYGGSDAFLMPSSFEPCGLGQMFAMRYGTVPVVRKTGGLADTVFDLQNGFTFEARDGRELAAAIERAAMLFRDRKTWKKLLLAGMNTDFSWHKSALEYVRMYEDAVSHRSLANAG